MPLRFVPSEVAALLGIVPVAWLALRRERRPLYWWIAAGFAVSFVADNAARFTDPYWVGRLYPLAQAVLIAVAFLDAGLVLGVTVALVAVGVLAFLLQPVGPDVALRSVAWLGVCVLAVERAPTRLQAALLVSFGVGWLAWMGYVLVPGWGSWATYQGARAVGIALFCWATRSLDNPLRGAAPQGIHFQP